MIEILNIDWQSEFRNLNVNEACEFFTRKYLEIADKCIPNHEITVRPKDKPWYNSSLRKLGRERDKAFKKFKKSNKLLDLVNYKNIRNKFNNKKKHAKKEHDRKFEENIKNSPNKNSKKFWKIVKEIMNSKGHNSNIPPLKKDDNTYAVTDLEKAECLASYFSSISTLDDSNIEPPNIDPIQVDNFLENITINKQDISDIISTLDINKASGPDKISHRMIKGTIKSITTPLEILFNKSLSEKVFPDDWKLAFINCLFKGHKQNGEKRDTSDKTNYRPISLLSCIGKILERIVYRHIYNQVRPHIYSLQSGFLEGFSTCYQLIELYHSMCETVDKKLDMCVTFFDFAKAFDTVWHKGLLAKLYSYGIRGDILEWIKNYLSNRKISVIINECASSIYSINSGVPQGSVLASIFFLIFINDITKNIENIMRLFADDSNDAVIGHNPDEIKLRLEPDLLQLQSWSETWLLNFNADKTVGLYISYCNEDEIPTIMFQNNEIKFKESHRHLGLTISSNLKWNDHITTIIETASKKINILRALKHRSNCDLLRTLYISYIRPALEYCCQVWDGCSGYLSDNLERLQLTAARVITGLPIFTNTDNLLTEARLTRLDTRRKYLRLCTFYKILDSDAPEYLQALIPSRDDEDDRILRNHNNIPIYQSRLETLRQSYIPSTIRDWNDLPDKTKQSRTLNQFKSRTIYSLILPYWRQIPFYSY